VTTRFMIGSNGRSTSTEAYQLDEYGPRQQWVVRHHVWSEHSGNTVDLSPDEARAAAAHLVACAEQVEALQRRKG
jgi:hypothetical protein